MMQGRLPERRGKILQAWLPAELAWWGRGAGWGAAERCQSALLLLSPASLLLMEKTAEWVFAHTGFGVVCLPKLAAQERRGSLICSRMHC